MKIDYYVVLLKCSCTVNFLVFMKEISNGSRVLILDNAKGPSISILNEMLAEKS